MKLKLDVTPDLVTMMAAEIAAGEKAVDTCIDRFDNVLNFRGEPYVPGQDAMMRYPDAR